MVISYQRAIEQLAHDLGVDPHDFARYASETQVGGRDTAHGWHPMAMHDVECRLLYATVRALRPDAVIEIGTAEGCTATHILTALTNNQYGELFSYDIDINAGHRIPKILRDRWHFECADALDVPWIDLYSDYNRVLVFEDGPHTYPWTRDMHEAIRFFIKPDVMITHDYYTHLTYPDFAVQQSCEEIYGDEVKGLHIEGAFTGLGYWISTL